MSEWQDISTAPSNTPVILTFDYQGVYGGISDNDDTLWYCPYGGGSQVPDPIAWIPLPLPPTTTSKEGGE